jgi:hypothetical protein
MQAQASGRPTPGDFAVMGWIYCSVELQSQLSRFVQFHTFANLNRS